MLPLLLVATMSLAVADARQSVPTSARLFDLAMAHGIADEKPVHRARAFAPDDDVIYLWYAAEGCAIGSTIRSVWFYLETDPPRQLAEASVVVDRPGTWGQFNFARGRGTPWAIGRYRVELRVGDELVAETSFEVTARTTVRLEQHPSAVETAHRP
jgi:hypothetical protein